MDIPKDLLNKEFLTQFKAEEDVSKFLTSLPSRLRYRSNLFASFTKKSDKEDTTSHRL